MVKLVTTSNIREDFKSINEDIMMIFPKIVDVKFAIERKKFQNCKKDKNGLQTLCVSLSEFSCSNVFVRH